MAYSILNNKTGLRCKKGQSTLELAVVFISMILLMGGMIKIWFWSNNQIVERQLRYNATRVAAGQPLGTGYTPVWPVYTPANLQVKDVILGP
jgi:hypothetical protein